MSDICWSFKAAAVVAHISDLLVAQPLVGRRQQSWYGVLSLGLAHEEAVKLVVVDHVANTDRARPARVGTCYDRTMMEQ